ncbi:hypothetical protein [Cohnella nanjingensis]|uniref:Uncharacterized protein n=1 Tax=Cohnella nanjingensis TaxID=1387779 RepID=A0A7X0RML1_9BACL|nr:hypothetical protein [Cohnella nanjingensis]MBB6670250.1 hypothetical protein [Cohnella nanjingensis]
MPIEIHIKGGNAAEAVQELADLAAHIPSLSKQLDVGQAPAAPVVSPAPSFPTAPAYPAQQAAYQAPEQGQVSYGQPQAPLAAVPVQPLVAPQTGVPVQQPPAQQPQGAVPVASAQEYTFDMLGVAATSLIDSDPNKQQLIVDCLRGQFGADSLMALPKEQYGAFATYLRSLGARV